jgi:hypothetical protein
MNDLLEYDVNTNVAIGGKEAKRSLKPTPRS